MSRLLGYAKTVFWILVFLNVTPYLVNGIKSTYSDLFTPCTKLGLLTIDTHLTDSTWYHEQLQSFFKDPEIKGILLKIESPGGTAGSSQALFSEINELKKTYPKPIISLTENICTSGAYYVACATDYIIVSPSALVGNIGAQLTTIFDLNACLEQWKIGTHVISAGTYKSAGDPFTTLTPQQKTLLESVTQDIYEQFAADVAQARKLSLKKKDEWADGKLFTGRQAAQLQLVDALGSLSTAVQKLKQTVAVHHEIVWVTPEKPFSLSGLLSGSNQEPSPLTKGALQLACGRGSLSVGERLRSLLVDQPSLVK